MKCTVPPYYFLAGNREQHHVPMRKESIWLLFHRRNHLSPYSLQHLLRKGSQWKKKDMALLTQIVMNMSASRASGGITETSSGSFEPKKEQRMTEVTHSDSRIDTHSHQPLHNLCRSDNKVDRLFHDYNTVPYVMSC